MKILQKISILAAILTSAVSMASPLPGMILSKNIHCKSTFKDFGSQQSFLLKIGEETDSEIHFARKHHAELTFLTPRTQTEDIIVNILPIQTRVYTGTEISTKFDGLGELILEDVTFSSLPTKFPLAFTGKFVFEDGSIDSYICGYQAN